MLDTLLTIHWNPDPTLFHLFGFPILYYSLLWIVGIACSYFIVRREYRDLKIGDDKFDPLFFYCFIGILVGCRLGHCLFYQPEYYLSGVKPFIEMFVPIKFLPDGDWKWTGYLGLASHGGTLGLIIALWLYCRKTKMHFMDVLDIIAVATPICACCIRLAKKSSAIPPRCPGLLFLSAWIRCPAIRHSCTRPSPTSSSAWVCCISIAVDFRNARRKPSA